MAYQIVLIIIAALLQGTFILEVWGVKPNLVLALLIVLIFSVRDWLAYSLLVIVGVLLLKSFPGVDWRALAIIPLALGSYFIKDWLPWRPYFSNIVLIAIATAIFSLPNFFPGEIIYNLILGTIIYFLLIHEKTRY
ncbi:MAG: hypothetical protein ABH822_01430 [Patescibacteria group bacterium]